MTVDQNVIPVINVEPLLGENSAAWTSIDQAIGEACEAFGGFVVVGLPKPLRPEIAEFRKLLSVFDLPQPILSEIGKREMRPESQRSLRGYVARLSGGFAYNEIFDVGPEPPVDGPPIKDIQLLTETNAWPQKEPAPGWRDEVIRQYRQLESFCIQLVLSFARYLNVNETAAAARYQNSNSTFRLLKYPERPPGIEIRGEMDAVRVHCGREYSLIGSEHTDNGGLTLLWQDQPGLQFQTPSGVWLDVPVISEGFAVLLGESLETQSSQRFLATPHRILGHRHIRHSMVFFLEPGLFSSTQPFSKDSFEQSPLEENTYAASLVETLRKTGRA